MLYIYTGDGKGKTSAALGLIMRAYGAGLRPAIIFFDKNPDYCNELKTLRELGITSYVFGINRVEEGAFRFGNIKDDLREAAKGIDAAQDILRKESPDVMILDEILNSVRLEQVPLQIVLDFIDGWPEEKYLVLTGRGLPEQIVERAHLVSDIQQIKHPLATQGAIAQKGIDY